MVKRLDDWSQRLSAYLTERAKMPFEWGVNDCMAFTAKGVEAITGQDFFTSYSDYQDEQSAKKMLEDNGGITGIIMSCLGAGHRDILKAKRGDVVIVKTPEIVGGIVDDTGQRIAMVTPQGLTRVPLSRAWRVWHV
jgi:hypothetical protein